MSDKTPEASSQNTGQLVRKQKSEQTNALTISSASSDSNGTLIKTVCFFIVFQKI